MTKLELRLDSSRVVVALTGEVTSQVRESCLNVKVSGKVLPRQDNLANWFVCKPTTTLKQYGLPRVRSRYLESMTVCCEVDNPIWILSLRNVNFSAAFESHMQKQHRYLADRTQLARHIHLEACIIMSCWLT